MYTRGLALLKDGLNLHWDSRILKYFIDFLCLDSQVREDSVVVYSDSKYLLFTNDEQKQVNLKEKKLKLENTHRLQISIKATKLPCIQSYCNFTDILLLRYSSHNLIAWPQLCLFKNYTGFPFHTTSCSNII